MNDDDGQVLPTTTPEHGQVDFGCLVHLRSSFYLKTFGRQLVFAVEWKSADLTAVEVGLRMTSWRPDYWRC